MKRGARRQRLNERSLIRPLIIASGRPARFVSTIMFGHSSDSATSAASGRQWSRKRRRKYGLSIGAYWCSAPAGRRRESSAADVTVPVVTSAVAPGARDALDERQQRDGFADARPVQPDEPAQRAGKACAAAPLADPLAVLLAPPEAQRQERDGERRPDRGQRAVDVQRERRGHAVLRFAPGSVAPTIA